jgi:hypothetical protein
MDGKRMFDHKLQLWLAHPRAFPLKRVKVKFKHFKLSYFPRGG